jgi:hypothetical protein
MNKKYIAFGFMGLFVMALATAGLITYYGSIEQDVSIESPITVTGETILAGGFSCGSYSGEAITIDNAAPFEVDVEITNDAPDGITVDYIGTLELSKKVVDFENTPWALVGDSVEVEYTVVGDNFNAEVTFPIPEYELVYYKDNSDRFNNPATAIAIADVSGNLPYEEDGNADEYDMCEVEEYSECHGAKLWYVPSDAVTAEEIDWSRADEFYFETNLIQYGNAITVYDAVEVTPVYNIGCDYVGEDTITTTIA